MPTNTQPLNEPLTEREIQILLKLSDGRLNKEIAGELFISLDTVKKHLKNIYKKINARNRIDAVHFALQLKSQDRSIAYYPKNPVI